MKKIIFLFSLLLFCGVVAAQDNVSHKTNNRRIESPESMARGEATKMKQELKLTDKQYDKLYAFLLKEKQSAIKSMTANGSKKPQGGPRGGMGRPNGQGGPDGGFGGGPGMDDFGGPGGQGKMGGSETGDFKAPPTNGNKPMAPEQMEKERAKRDKKIAKIIGKEKYAQWKEKHAQNVSLKQ